MTAPLLSQAPAWKVSVVTIFPEAFPGPLALGVLGRAIERGRIALDVRDLREHGLGSYRQVDDAPFGGGPGMVLRPEPLFAAVEEIVADAAPERPWVVLMDPGGRPLRQDVARELSQRRHVVLLCGRYEGIDERVRERLVDDEISIGDYVLSGGELAAMIVMDAAGRLVPGVVGEPQSIVRESFEEPLLDYPHYTRPADFRGFTVPEVLISGDHARIERWRREKALERTLARRPDLRAPSPDAMPGSSR